MFIWAVTALEFIGERDQDPVERLRIIQAGTLPGRGVYALYRQILETSFPNHRHSSDFVKLAGAVIAGQRYLTPKEWAGLLRMDHGTTEYIHSMLRTVVVNEDVIRFRHQSFVDFLLGRNDGLGINIVDDEPESGCPKCFRVDISEAHQALAQASFLLMNTNLHFNTHNIKSSFLRNNAPSSDGNVNAVAPILAYVCEFWGFHLQRSRPSYTIDTYLLVQFLQEVSLYWIESLSVLGKLNIAVGALDVLRRHLASTNVSFQPDDVEYMSNLC